MLILQFNLKEFNINTWKDMIYILNITPIMDLFNKLKR